MRAPRATRSLVPVVALGLALAGSVAARHSSPELPAARQPASAPSELVGNLEIALGAMMAIERAGGWPRVDGPSLRAGDRGAAVVILRERLAIGGDLTADSTVDAALFDATVHAAVLRFQHRHALVEDGVVGPATRAELNVPPGRRIEQLRLNLERARAIDVPADDRMVLVNAAGATAYLFEQGRVVFTTRAVVGKASTPTPRFSAWIEQVELNPYWNVPPGIVAEVLADVRADRGYLARTGMRVVDRAGRVLDPRGIDFRRYTGRSFPWQFRQDPGPANPLGPIKLVFPNRYHVYMHGTPAPELFLLPHRYYSHGCIRLEYPIRLAELLLASPDWSEQALRNAIATGETRTVDLPEPVRVQIAYLTAVADANGRASHYPDVYGLDAGATAAAAQPISVSGDDPSLASADSSVVPDTRCTAR